MCCLLQRVLTLWSQHLTTGVSIHVLFHISLLSFTKAGHPSTPQNLTVERLTPTSATLRWGVERLTPQVHPATLFKVTIETMKGTIHSAKTTETLPGSDRGHTIKWLQPETEYRIYMRAYDDSGNRSNSSGVIMFRTLAQRPDGLVVHPGEVLVVVAILIVWFCAIAKFVHKWSKLRIMHPRDYHWKQQPKNIETIRVVKHHQDSVIYRTYSKRVSKTMQARACREKRFQRMMTMPNIKVGSEVTKEESERNENDCRLKSAVPLLEVEGESTDGSST